MDGCRRADPFNWLKTRATRRASGWRPGSGMSCIVILDDRATNRAIYSQLARSVGQDVSVTVFSDAAEALGWLQENRADLIVTDYEMPRIDGDEFITRFRALPGSARVPIMMITVCSQRQKRLRALESGATDFLRAPVDHCEFITRARNLLRLSRSATPLAELRRRPRRRTRRLRRTTSAKTSRPICSHAAARPITPFTSSKLISRGCLLTFPLSCAAICAALTSSSASIPGVMPCYSRTSSGQTTRGRFPTVCGASANPWTASPRSGSASPCLARDEKARRSAPSLACARPPRWRAPRRVRTRRARIGDWRPGSNWRRGRSPGSN